MEKPTVSKGNPKRLKKGKKVPYKKGNKGKLKLKKGKSKGGASKGKPPAGQFSAQDVSQNVTEEKTISPQVMTQLPIQVMMDNAAGMAMVYPIASYLLENGYFGNFNSQPEGVVGTPADILISGLSYMMEGLATIAQGATDTITRVPKLVNVIAEALRSKVVPFKTGQIAYAWSQNLNWNVPVTYNSGNTNWVFGDCPSAPADVWNSPIALATSSPNVAAYNFLLKYFSKTGTLTETIDIKTKEITSNDASMFARQYAYNGIGNTTTGGWYCDAESEVPIRCPMLSKLVPYGATNMRVGRFLMPSAGDSGLITGLPLMPSFKYKEYKNKYTPIFKCIDVNEIISWLAIFAGAVRDRYASEVDSVTSSDTLLNIPFDFSLQDFAILVRQALMSVFSTQKMVQFLQPRFFNGTDNGFIPFVSSCGTFGDPYFQGMMLPTYLVENINSLKMHEFQPPVQFKSDKNVYRIIPVLGVFKLDTLPVITFTPQGGEATPVFSSLGQVAINLWDGSISPTFYDFNANYYKKVMNQWNEFCTEAQKYTTPLSNIGSDSGVRGLPLGTFTRFGLVNNVEDIQTRIRSRMTERINRRVVNYRPVCYDFTDRKVLEKTPSMKNLPKELKGHDIQNLPAASVTTLTTSDLTMVDPITSELQGYLNSLILPVQRVDPKNAEFPTTIVMFQTESLESARISYGVVDDAENISGPTTYSRLVDQVGMNVPGTAASLSPTYVSIMRVLQNSGQSAGLLGSLLGGFANSFLGGTPLQGIANLAEQIPF